jgi:hypothetical protein
MSVIGTVAIRVQSQSTAFRKDMAGTAATLASFESKLSQASAVVSGLFAAAVGGAGALALGRMVTQSSNLAESIGKVGAIFGKEGKGVQSDAEAMANTFGVSLNTMLDGAGKLGGLFKGAGFGEAETANLSKQFNHLTLDASRFFNVPYDVAFQKIRSGLAGEAEPLRDFGVFLTADKIQAQALSMGLVKLGETMTDQAKITATAAIIQTGLADAQGNAAATAGGAAAKIEEFKGRVDNLITTLGEGLTPIAGAALGGLSTAIVAMSNAWDQSKESVFAWVKTTVDSLGIAGGSVGILQSAIGGIADTWQMIAIGFQGAQTLILGGFTKIVEGAAWVARGFDSLHEKVLGWSTGIGEEITTLADSMKNSLAESVKDVKAEWSKPWASVSVNQQFEKARMQLDGLVAKAAEAKKITTKLETTMPAKKKDVPTLSAAQFAGSKEAVSTVFRTKYGVGKDSTAENTKKTADTLSRIETVMREGNRISREKAEGIPLDI